MIAVHIGLRKAGSATLQEFLRANQDELLKYSIDYPAIGRGNSKEHHNLVYEITDRKRFNASLGTLDDLSRYWHVSRNEIMVLSSEMFESADFEQISKIKSKFLACRGGERFVIILILRDLLDLIVSSYGQKIKYGIHGYGFDEFFSSRIKECRNDYYHTAKQWACVFGWESMCIRLLDRQYLMNSDLVDDFLATLGMDIVRVQQLSFKRPGISNVSPGWRVLEAVRALFNGLHGLPAKHPLTAAARQNGRSRILGNIAMKVGERRGWNDERGYYLTRAQAQECLEIYRRAITALNELLPEKLPSPLDLETRGFRERDFMPDASFIDCADLQSFYEELWSTLSAKKSRRRDTGRS
jgi:hypothetical protein